MLPLWSRPPYFYPRPPRGGRRGLLFGSYFFLRFLSTPSARRATKDPDRVRAPWEISIHALREEGDAVQHRPYTAGSLHFYPRPPRGGRLKLCAQLSDYLRFLSTPSARRATKSDFYTAPASTFLSTPSARRATSARFAHRPPRAFLSTPSARRATPKEIKK